MPTLVVRGPDGKEREVSLSGEMSIGRAEGCDLILAEGGVSRTHAKMTVKGESVVVEISRFTTPCLNITASFVDGDYSRVSEKRHPGWSRVYARVLEPGVLRRGDFVRVLDSTPRAPAAP